MTEKKWKQVITDNCKAVGTYKEAFDPTIATLASILAQRDKTNTEYKKSGEQSVVEHTNKNGSTNPTKNPRLVMVNVLNQSALAYLNALGLTPIGLKKLNETAMLPPKKNALAEAVKKLG